MAHARKTIRDQVAQMLAGLTLVPAANVFPTRTYAVDEDHLPAICIYTLSEESGLDALGPRKMARHLELIVEIVAKVNDTLDDTLDAISAEVENIIGTNFTLGGTAKDCMLSSTKIAVRGEGDKPTGSAVLTYSVMYRTLAADAALIA